MKETQLVELFLGLLALPQSTLPYRVKQECQAFWERLTSQRFEKQSATLQEALEKGYVEKEIIDLIHDQGEVPLDSSCTHYASEAAYRPPHAYFRKGNQVQWVDAVVPRTAPIRIDVGDGPFRVLHITEYPDRFMQNFCSIADELDDYTTLHVSFPEPVREQSQLLLEILPCAHHPKGAVFAAPPWEFEPYWDLPLHLFEEETSENP